MKKLLFLFGCFPLLLFGQEITLDSCQAWARANYPLIRSKQLLQQSLDVKKEKLNTNWLPQLSLNGQASYQSDVTKLDINIPNFPFKIDEPDKDIIKVAVDVSQTIYDGGFTKYQKQIEEASANAEIQQNEVEIYKIRERVNQLYFSILSLNNSRKITELLKAELEAKLKKTEAGLLHGIASQSNHNILKAEIIKVEQQLIEINFALFSLYAMLSEYIGKEITATTQLKSPDVQVKVETFHINRPELKYYDLLSLRLDKTSELLKSQTFPKVVAFGQAGYGKPGLNMLKSEFEPYWIIGAKLNWNLWDRGQNKRDNEIMKIQKDMLSLQKETFEKNIKISAYKLLAEIRKTEQLIEKDKEIIALREAILKSTESQYENGTLTASEYITDANALMQAKINLENHKLQLISIYTEYKTLTGNN